MSHVIADKFFGETLELLVLRDKKVQKVVVRKADFTTCRDTAWVATLRDSRFPLQTAGQNALCGVLSGAPGRGKRFDSETPVGEARTLPYLWRPRFLPFNARVSEGEIRFSLHEKCQVTAVSL